jgi:CAAX protease family protein
MQQTLLENEVSAQHEPQPGRNIQTTEVAVFLFLILPSMVLSLFVVRQGNLDFVIAAIATIFRDLALVSLVWFFVWRNGEPFGRLGWRGRHAGREVLIGCLLFVPFTFGAAFLERALLGIGLSAPSTSLPSFLAPRGVAEGVLATALVTVVAFAEETLFRGYLLLRLRAVLGSTSAAVMLSSAIFALGHGYEGSAGLVTVGMMGVVFALVYHWRGSLVAPAVMHFLQDFIGIVLVPLLGTK